MKKYTLLLFVAATSIVYSCKKEVNTPIKATVNTDASVTNNGVNTTEKTVIGRTVFYDKRVSANDAAACIGCHAGFVEDKQDDIPVKYSVAGNSNKSISELEKLSQPREAHKVKGEDLVPFPEVPNGHSDLEKLPNLASKLSKVNYYKDLFRNAYGNEEITEARLEECMKLFLTSQKAVVKR